VASSIVAASAKICATVCCTRRRPNTHAKVLAAPFDRDNAERARNKFIEMQALIDALDRAINGEQVVSPKN
jgi:hypothetical protein